MWTASAPTSPRCPPRRWSSARARRPDRPDRRPNRRRPGRGLPRSAATAAGRCSGAAIGDEAASLPSPLAHRNLHRTCSESWSRRTCAAARTHAPARDGTTRAHGEHAPPPDLHPTRSCRITLSNSAGGFARAAGATSRRRLRSSPRKRNRLQEKRWPAGVPGGQSHKTRPRHCPVRASHVGQRPEARGRPELPRLD